jgi:tetratricopeptide (TPR) repeat protein
MREGTSVYDRLNLLFKLIPALNIGSISPAEWMKARAEKEAVLLEHAHPRDVFYAVFDAGSVLMPPSFTMTAYGLLHRAMEKEVAEMPYKVTNLWRYYATESIYEAFTRDFMNRQIHAHFRLRYGQFLFAGGNRKGGLQSVLEATITGSDDSGVQLVAASILMNEDLLNEAREALDRASSFFPRGSPILDNSWGCYFFRRKDYDRAVGFFNKAAEASPLTALYHRNLALALKSAGRDKEALTALDAFSEIHPYPQGLEDLLMEEPQEAGMR